MKLGNSEQIGQRIEFPSENSLLFHAVKPPKSHSRNTAKTIQMFELITGDRQ
jgi:hypothetical protein